MQSGLCCFSGAFAEGLSAKDDGTVDLRSQLGGEGRAVLTSSNSIQYSFEQEEEDDEPLVEKFLRIKFSKSYLIVNLLTINN